MTSPEALRSVPCHSKSPRPCAKRADGRSATNKKIANAQNQNSRRLIGHYHSVLVFGWRDLDVPLNQLLQLRTFANKNAWRVVREYGDVGKNGTRAEFQQMSKGREREAQPAILDDFETAHRGGTAAHRIGFVPGIAWPMPASRVRRYRSSALPLLHRICRVLRPAKKLSLTKP